MSQAWKVVLAYCFAANCAGVAVAAQPVRTQDAGEAQARADLAAGRAAKLYWHVLNGVVPSRIVPGLAECRPHFDGDRSKNLFVHLRPADYQEGGSYSKKQLKGKVTASQYAASYNREMFRLQRAAILEVCPQARLRSDGD